MLFELLVAVLVVLGIFAVSGLYYAVKTKPKDIQLFVWLLKLIDLRALSKDIRGSPLIWLMADRRGVAGVLGLVLGVVTAAIAMIIGLYVFASVATTIPSTGCATADQVIQNVQSNTFQAFILLAVGIIVLGAAFIISILVRAFGGGQ